MKGYAHNKKYDQVSNENQYAHENHRGKFSLGGDIRVYGNYWETKSLKNRGATSWDLTYELN